MADISKITTLDGVTYNIKDAVARHSIPIPATETPQLEGAGAVGTSTKYAREDHVHPRKPQSFVATIAPTGVIENDLWFIIE